MKRVLLTLLLCLPAPAFAQQINLIGFLTTDAKKPMPATKVSVAGGPIDETDSKGQFKIVLSNDFKEGERVIINVIKPGWVIDSPLDGEWNLPNLKLQNIQTLNVVIVPNGSKALWTHARIEKLVAKLSDEIARLKKDGDRPGPVDFTRSLGEWARQYGFTPAEVKEQFDQWAKSVENSEDYRTLGLRAFYLKNFALAAENFDKAGRQSDEKIKRTEQQLSQDKLDAYQNWRLAGITLFNLYKFREAVERFTRALSYAPKDGDPEAWAEIKILTGNAKSELGIRVEGEESNRLLSDSENEYREALTVYTRDQLPQEWARIQSNLGNTFQSQGMRLAEKQAVRLLAESVDAYRRALTVYTREQTPQEWALTQNNLGAVLIEQGKLADDEQSARLLAEAVAACRQALTVHTRDQLPHEWAMTQNVLGNALRVQSAQETGEQGVRLLAEAVTAFRQALTVYTRDELPQLWALTQNNLGGALIAQSERVAGEQGIRLLAEAVAACKQALTVYTRDQLPQKWAMTQNFLGLALTDQGGRVAGEQGVRLLTEAVAAFRQALTVYTRDQLPQLWALMQRNLGKALRAQGELTAGEQGARLLAEAVEIFKQTLSVYTREQSPHYWALTQSDLANAYFALQNWYGAADAYADVLTLYPDDEESYQRLSYICHEILFLFREAFDLNRRWLIKHSDDLAAQADFAEKHVTTGRFAECEQRIAPLLANSKIAADGKAALRAIEIANLLALGKANQVPAKLDALIESVAGQPAGFKVRWSFAGMAHFIGKEEKLKTHRAWLGRLFGALQSENRDAMLKALREAKADFKP